jgi:hypothetical protein
MKRDAPSPVMQLFIEHPGEVENSASAPAEAHKKAKAFGIYAFIAKS